MSILVEILCIVIVGGLTGAAVAGIWELAAYLIRKLEKEARRG